MRKDASTVKKRRALVVDPSVRGESHILGNAGFINHVLERYDEVTVIAESEHINCLKQYIDSESRANLAFYPWYKNKDVIKIFKGLKENNKFDKLIFLNLEFMLFVSVNIFFRNIACGKTSWLLHSHFAASAAGDKRSTIKRELKAVLLFSIFSKNEFLVYGTRIKHNLSNLLGRERTNGKLRVILHPVSAQHLRNAGTARTANLDFVPRILHLPGWHPLSERTKDLVERIKSRALIDKKFDFFSIKNELSVQSDNKVLTVPYSQRIEDIASYDLFLHLPEDSYRLQASGTIMDALLTLTPIIGIKTEFSDEITSIIGQFGFFFSGRDELEQFLSRGEISRDKMFYFRSNLLNGYEKIVTESRRNIKEWL